MIANSPVILAEICKPWIKRKGTNKQSFDNEVAVGRRLLSSHVTADNILTAEQIATKCGWKRKNNGIGRPAIPFVGEMALTKWI
jgi:hypothetical protein